MGVYIKSLYRKLVECQSEKMKGFLPRFPVGRWSSALPDWPGYRKAGKARKRKKKGKEKC